MFNRTDFYKELYYNELERRVGLTNEVTLISTTLVALISGTFYLITSFTNQNTQIRSAFQYFGLICLIPIFVTAYFAFRSYYDFKASGRKYIYLPTVTEIEKYHKDCLAQGQDTEFEEFLRDMLVGVADHHIQNNDQKSTLLTTAAKWLSKSFVSCSVLVLLFLFNIVLTSLPPADKQESHEPRQRADSNTTTSPSTVSRATNPSAKTIAQGNNRKRGQQQTTAQSPR